MEKNFAVKIPDGTFCYDSGNCSTCVYFEARNTDSNGRGYCNYYGSHFYPSERQGCLSRKAY